jgi:thiamine biosynthesis lipoprotein
VYNKWNAKSEVSQFNRAQAGEKIALSNDLQKLLELTNKVVNVTGGRFDPTIEPIQKLWKERLAAGMIPSAEEIGIIAPAIGWHNVHYADGMIWKDHNATSLDLGGIAKGYAIDLLVEKLISSRYRNVYVEWGGEIRSQGKHPEDRPWTIFISRLTDEDPDHAVATLMMDNNALATSGDYLQNTTVDGITYFHIIDPRTLRPLVSTPTSIASASVLAKTCAFADGLATAAMLFTSEEEAIAWFKKLKENDSDLSLWLVTREMR